MTEFMVGELVCSEFFSGVAKLLSLNHNRNEAVVSFFESPLNPECRLQTVDLFSLEVAQLYEEAVVYCQDQESGIWRRARYAGSRPGNRHLIIFRSDEQEEVSVDQIYCLNIAKNSFVAPAEFLAARSNDAPFFCPLRDEFLTAYIAQRAACQSISSISSSNVELEPHQLAVVRRVLKDPIPKYLLADEVGLGKTIEAGMIIREHVLEKKTDAKILVAVPDALVEQWHDELAQRFHLGELLGGHANTQQLIHICSHESASTFLEKNQPTLLVIDEVHQVASWAWSEQTLEQKNFDSLAKGCQQAAAVLLLSGTPLNGNEKNFLAILHCLSPDAYELSDSGLQRFLIQVADREIIGGWYGALTEDNSNAALEEILKNLENKFSDDQELQVLVNQTMPLVDFFADEAGEPRAQAIRMLKRYIGEHYRLHQRMLRNRRESEELEFLFPGLAGLKRVLWQPNNKMPPLDWLLEEYRSQASLHPENFKAMSVETYLLWVDDVLVSPLLVGQRADQALAKLEDSLESVERNLLHEISQQAVNEQQAKDNSLVECLKQWLADNEKGKVVVFCSVDKIAQHVFSLLASELDIAVERYIPGRELRFTRPNSSIRVLVCDHRGEDGLNLHGGQKIAVHYSLPRSFSSIEQRLGRLNRYSGNLRGVRPVESLVVLPKEEGLIKLWVDLLDQTVGLFDRTVASLQYVLENHLDTTWAIVATSGEQALKQSAQELNGSDGLIAKELSKVKVQEELLALDHDVSEATLFSEEIADADELADEQGVQMYNWIARGLFFNVEGDQHDLFRFRFGLGGVSGERKTLVDVKTFIANCFIGIDPQSGNPPATALMSFSRGRIAEESPIYPFRYGQPFVDSIYNLIKNDSRGATSAILRVITNSQMKEPQMFFRLTWLATTTDLNCNRAEQISGDEFASPVILSHWIAQDSSLVTSDSILRPLEIPYTKNHSAFQDVNLRSNVWSELETFLPAKEWQEMVLAIASKSREQVEFDYQKTSDLSPSTHFNLLSMNAVVLCTTDMLQGA